MTKKNIKRICANCIDEEYFKKHIESNNILGICTYCGNKKNILELNTIIKDIIEGIEFIYDDPVNGLGYSDGEYVKGNGDILDTYDLLTDKFEFGGSKAFQDILDSLPNQLWCKKVFYGLDTAQEKIYTWDYFVNQVKYKTRYFFIQEKINMDEHLPYNKPFDILKDFATSIEKLNLIDKLNKGSIIYRARRNENGKKYKSPAELGTPKAKECVKPNRMSPAGIPMFYGSQTKETCLSELRNVKGEYSIGKWMLTEELSILNLTLFFKFDKDTNKYYYPDFPSVFDIDNRKNIFEYQFILKFASDLSGKVNDNVASIEYIPTQIVAEYLKKIALFNNNNLDGICFYSSIDGGINYALFIEQEGCIDSTQSHTLQQKIKLISVDEVEI